MSHACQECHAQVAALLCRECNNQLYCIGCSRDVHDGLGAPHALEYAHAAEFPHALAAQSAAASSVFTGPPRLAVPAAFATPSSLLHWGAPASAASLFAAMPPSPPVAPIARPVPRSPHLPSSVMPPFGGSTWLGATLTSSVAPHEQSHNHQHQQQQQQQHAIDRLQHQIDELQRVADELTATERRLASSAVAAPSLLVASSSIFPARTSVVTCNDGASTAPPGLVHAHQVATVAPAASVSTASSWSDAASNVSARGGKATMSAAAKSAVIAVKSPAAAATAVPVAAAAPADMSSSAARDPRMNGLGKWRTQMCPSPTTCVHGSKGRCYRAHTLAEAFCHACRVHGHTVAAHGDSFCVLCGPRALPSTPVAPVAAASALSPTAAAGSAQTHTTRQCPVKCTLWCDSVKRGVACPHGSKCTFAHRRDQLVCPYCEIIGHGLDECANPNLQCKVCSKFGHSLRNPNVCKHSRAMVVLVTDVADYWTPKVSSSSSDASVPASSSAATKTTAKATPFAASVPVRPVAASAAAVAAPNKATTVKATPSAGAHVETANPFSALGGDDE